MLGQGYGGAQWRSDCGRWENRNLLAAVSPARAESQWLRLQGPGATRQAATNDTLKVTKADGPLMRNSTGFPRQGWGAGLAQSSGNC